MGQHGVNGDVCSSFTYYYADSDGDGFGAGPAVIFCTLETGYVMNNADCDDSNFNTNPGAPEICANGIDDNCNAQTDEINCQCTTSSQCPAGYVCQLGTCVLYCPPIGTPCDDGNSCTINDTEDGICNCTGTPAPEICDGIDNDCDGLIDEGFDVDGDGFTTCGGDCDDNDSSVHPGAIDLCGGGDDDCDGDVETCPSGFNCNAMGVCVPI